MLRIRRVALLIACFALIASACRRSVDGPVEDAAAPTGAETPTEPELVPPIELPSSPELRRDETTMGWPLNIAATPPPENPQRLGIAADARTGLLDNGLVYYVRSHSEPEQSLSLRLAVDAGSLQQQQPDSGLAHFVEHMLFNGTEAYPGNDLDAVLQRLGADLGPDLNAYTSTDETVYALELQQSDAELFDTAFTVLREWSSNAVFAPDEVKAERGVVREETRSHYTSASAELVTTFEDSYDYGTDYLGRFPGGRGEAIMEITPDQARRFYQRWYRPDNMAIVAVGDYPIDELEAAIIDRFSDVAIPDEPLPTVSDPGSGWNDEPIVETITVPSSGRSEVSIDWPVPTNHLATVGDLDRFVREQLLVAVLDERLARLSDTSDVGIFDAGASQFEWNRARSIIGLNAGTDDLLASTTLILSEFAAVAERGVSDDEFQRAVEAWQADIEAVRQRRVTNTELADVYVKSFLVGSTDVFDEAFIEGTSGVLSGLGPQDITEYWRFIASHTAPIVLLISEDSQHAVSREAAVGAVASASPDSAVATEDVVEITTLVEPPPPEEPTESFAIDSLDQPAHSWSYDNGATVVYVESSIEPDTFAMIGQQRGGTSQFDDSLGPLADLAVEAVERSALMGNSRASVARFADKAQIDTTMFAVPYGQGFAASGVVSGFEAALQLLYARATAPQIDEAGWPGASRTYGESLRFGALDPATQANDELFRLRFGDDSAWHVTPSPQSAASATPEEMLSMYEDLFGALEGPMTFVIVGDLAVDDVRAFTDSYLGNLPSRSGGGPVAREGDPLDEVRTSTITLGEPNTSGELIEYFEMKADVDDAGLVETTVAAHILDQRLFDAVREELSATYGGLVQVEPSAGPTTGFETRIAFTGDPERLEEMRDRILEEISDLAELGPSEDELQRVRAVLETDWSYVSNADLLEQGFGAVERADALRWGDVGVASVPNERKQQLLANVSVEDVRTTAASLWPRDRRVEVIRVPKAS